MNKEIKPIQTHYDGRYFRSRCEARWAVFFKTLGLAYDYEPEGYQLSSGWYLPDFYLPSLDCFIEIKGGNPNQHERDLMFELSNIKNKICFLFAGNPRHPGVYDDFPDRIKFYNGKAEYGFWFCECPLCQKIFIEKDGYIIPHRPHHKDFFKNKFQNVETPKLIGAYTASLSARFEF